MIRSDFENTLRARINYTADWYRSRANMFASIAAGLEQITKPYKLGNKVVAKLMEYMGKEVGSRFEAGEIGVRIAYSDGEMRIYTTQLRPDCSGIYPCREIEFEKYTNDVGYIQTQPIVELVKGWARADIDAHGRLLAMLTNLSAHIDSCERLMRANNAFHELPPEFRCMVEVPNYGTEDWRRWLRGW